MKVAILTGGGDCPGLNAVIRAVTRRCAGGFKCEVVGVHNGWRGMVDADFVYLDQERISGILPLGGTILGTSRTNPYKEEGSVQAILDTIAAHDIGAIVVVGGEDTLGVALRLHEEHGIHVVGVPKTIDNDLSGTDYTFGFDTAVQIASEAIDRLHSTAESHNRTMVVEVMGRHAGWIAVMAGIAGGADAILIPEYPLPCEDVAELIKGRLARGKKFSIVVVSEGAALTWRSGQHEQILASNETDSFGHVRLGGVGTVLGHELERMTGIETRVAILGYIQRGGTPTARDRVLATRFGIKAAEMVHFEEWGKMAALQGDTIAAIPLSEALRETKLVPRELYDLSAVFFG